MKKGFTLVELLIVMVIVGILVTVALPKYRATMERGRAAEAIANLKIASDWINAKYVLNGNSYPSNENMLTVEVSMTSGSGSTSSSGSRSVIGAASRSVYFTKPEFTTCSGYKCIKTERKQGSTVYYTLTAYNQDGELKKITCTGTEKELCKTFGMTLSGSAYQITF